MAKQQHDREDLLREATALVVRAELQLNSDAHPVVAGFRQGGEASFYFGFDPVFQFNSERQLRRAFYDGRLIKAEQGALIALAR
ncbi:MAG: hypothetical protein KDA41_11745, partial [Planctomycetales bacterium]|nr:hypothetical protein [Planctomycetales bacterium]